MPQHCKTEGLCQLHNDSAEHCWNIYIHGLEMFPPGLQNTSLDFYSLGYTYIELFVKRKVWPGLHTGVEIMQKVCGLFTNPTVMPKTDHLQPCFDCCQFDDNKRRNIDTVLQTLIKNFKY